MKKIMFDDRFELTQAVIDGRKTETRRIIYDWMIKEFNEDYQLSEIDKESIIEKFSKYKVGEEVAVAQKYDDIMNWQSLYELTLAEDPYFPIECVGSIPGKKNKMFVKAEWMPFRIRITDVKVERQWDISEEDCIKEGAMKDPVTDWYYFPNLYRHRRTKYSAGPTLFCNPKHAYVELCRKLRLILDSYANPWVFAYTFVLK